MGSAEPSHSGVDKHKGTAAGGGPGLAPSRGGGGRTSEGTNPCTRPSFATTPMIFCATKKTEKKKLKNNFKIFFSENFFEP